MAKKKNKACGTGTNTRGTIRMDDGRAFHGDCATLEDGGVIVTVKSATAAAIRSEKANAYYFGHVLERIHVYCPEHSVEEIHDAMCALFLPNDKKRALFISRMTGAELELDLDDHRRSSRLNGKDFYQFVEKVRLWALEFYGCETYDPDPEWRRWAA